MNAAESYCGILLAAGRSTRFGDDKLLHPLADGTPMALASARAMLRALPRLIAVVNADNRELARLFERDGVAMIAAPAGADGMGTSLAAGVAARPQARGWIVALADMPFIRPQSIAAVRDALAAGASLAAPVYHGQRGHPVGFAGEFRAALMQLGGDAGARGILRQHQSRLHLIAGEDPGVVRDIDHADDLRGYSAGPDSITYNQSHG